MEADDLAKRQAMVANQIQRRGIHDKALLSALLEVPRHLFVPEALRKHAYEDTPLSIGYDQTISQPYIVALMIQAAQLSPESIALEIGTGSGYAASVLSHLVKEVYTIERLPALAAQAQTVIKQLHLENIHIKIGDGSLGWPEKGPFNAIIATAGSPVVPQSLLNQLVLGGTLIIPVGDAISQQLLRLRKTGSEQYSREIIEWVRFVPLLGKEGWPE
jgi:protein-L-isoaspartate(D-aspartate) O-methyltransferase